MPTRSMSRQHVAKSLFCICVLSLLSGCILAYYPQPFPIFPYGPSVDPLPEHKDNPLIEQALAEGANGNSTRSFVIAMRGARIVGKEKRNEDHDNYKALPTPNFIPALWLDYMSPPSFSTPKEGKRHYYNFTITKQYAKGMDTFLAGEGEQSVEAFESVINDKTSENEMCWQASMHLVFLHLMMGRPDLAEIEVKRTEYFESIMTYGSNYYSRALRAEVRYWAGDFDGAIRDIKDIVSAIGKWDMPTFYPSPPVDQVKIARLGTAKIRAMGICGLIFITQGRYKEALPWLEQAAKDMNDGIFIHKHPLYSLYINANNWEIFYGQGWCLTSLATALMAIDPDSKRAAEMYVHAQDYFDAIGYAAGKVMIESFKAQVLLATGHYQRAEQQAGVALEHARKTKLLDFVWRMEAVRGEALLKLDRWDEAENALRAAQTVVDLLSGTMISDKAKVRFGVGKEIITKNLVMIDVRRKDWASLFQDMERGRARAFVSMLANRAVAVDSHDDTITKIHNLDREILKVRQKKYGFLQENKAGTNLEEELLAKRQELVEELHAKYPDLAEAYAVSSVALSRVQKSLSAGDLMVYALPAQGEEPLSLLLVNNNEAQTKSLQVNAAQFGKHLQAFVATIGKQQKEAELLALMQLKNDLAIGQWGTFKNLLVIPSGDLHFVPWGALDVPFTVGVLPTGGWIIRSPHKSRGVVQASLIGDPDFGGLLPQLPGARDEALELAKCYATSALVGADATEAALRQQVGKGVDVLHLATHALYDPLYPLQSSLFLTDGHKAVPLSAEKLYKNPLPSRLVVLSACETGMGQVTSGDDLLGLTRSFYLGGANVILSSLWPVNDEATRIFMEVFHETSRKETYGKAWLAARDAVKARGYAPSEYGAFILGGMPNERRAFDPQKIAAQRPLSSTIATVVQ